MTLARAAALKIHREQRAYDPIVDAWWRWTYTQIRYAGDAGEILLKTPHPLMAPEHTQDAFARHLWRCEPLIFS